MNIKKMFTTLSAMVVACAMLLPNASVLAASYSQELQDAYNWAYSKGVTTMSPIDNANMYGAITRSEMAKMLSVYATEVLGMTPDTTAACTFSDIASVKGDLHDYIIESCQLGIMGQGISAFRPYDTISRAEFGTALSRVLWGSQYEGGTPYYAKHLDALKAAGIMTQISNAESTKEIRGYVMLMLMRSEGNDAVVDCDDPMTVIACTTNTDACPAACKNADEKEDTVVKSGDLAVTAKAAEGRRVIAYFDEDTDELSWVSDIDTLTFKTSEEVTLNKITLERYGYLDAAFISWVWLEDADGNMITDPKSLNNKDLVTLSVKKDYRKIDGTFNATIVVELWILPDADLDETDFYNLMWSPSLGFKVTDADSTAKNLNLDDYTPYTYTVTFYKGSAVTVDRAGTDKNYNYEAGEMYEVARFRVKASNSPILLNWFTLVNTLDTEDVDGVASKGQADIAKYLDKVEVTINGEKVSAKYSVNKDDELVISFDQYELEAKKSASFVVKLSLDEFEDYGRWVKFALTSNNLKAVEKKTGARVTVNGLDDLVWAGHLFRGGKIKLVNTKLGTVEAAAGSVNRVVAEWEISVGEPIKMGTFTILTDRTAIEAMTLVIAWEEYDGTKVTGGFKFSKVTIEKSGKVQFKVDLVDETDVTSVTFQVQNSAAEPVTKNSFDKNAFYGAEYEELRNEKVSDADVSGSITFSSLKIKAPTASLENKLAKSKPVEFITDQPDRKVVFNGTYTAKKWDVNLNSFWFIANADNAATLTSDNLTFYVFVDWDEVGSTSVFGADKIERFSDVKVKEWTSVAIKVEADVDVPTEGWTTTTAFNYDLYLQWEDADGVEVGQGSDFVAPIKIKATGSVIIPPTKSNTVLLKGMSQTIAEFTVKPSNGNEGIYLDTLTVTVTPAVSNPAQDLKVKVDWDEVTYDADANKYKPNKELPTEGVVVEVILRWEAVDDYEVTVTANNTTKTLSRLFVPALVTVVSQTNMTDSTKYTLDVEKYDDDDQVTNLMLYGGKCDNDGEFDAELSTCKPLLDTAKATVVDWDTVVAYAEDKAQAITAIVYTVVPADPEQSNTPVEILKAVYEDFFVDADGNPLKVDAK